MPITFCYRRSLNTCMWWFCCCLNCSSFFSIFLSCLLIHLCGGCIWNLCKTSCRIIIIISQKYCSGWIADMLLQMEISMTFIAAGHHHHHHLSISFQISFVFCCEQTFPAVWALFAVSLQLMCILNFCGFCILLLQVRHFLLLYTRTESGYSDHNFADKERIEMYVCMYVCNASTSIYLSSLIALTHAYWIVKP